MLDNELPIDTNDTTAGDGDSSGDAAFAPAPVSDDATPAKKVAAKRAPRKTAARKTAKKAATKATDPTDEPVAEATAPAAEPPTSEPTVDTTAAPDPDAAPAAKKTARKTAARKTTAKRASKKTAAPEPESESPAAEAATVTPAEDDTEDSTDSPARSAVAPLFQAPDPSAAKPTRKRAARKRPAKVEDEVVDEETPAVEDTEAEPEKAVDAAGDAAESESGDEAGTRRRPRRRGGRRRRKGSGDAEDGTEDNNESSDADESGDDASEEGGGTSSSASRRRRRRRRSGDDGDGSSDDPANTVTRVRKPRNPEDEITALQGSTRLEAKKQRRREGREAGRRRAPIVSEAEFLARREAVDRVMVIRQRDDLTQIGVLEDKVLVEHYVARESQTSLIGNVYLGRVQNVLPSMEAAFIDIGKGRNAVLYAGEVNWKALGAKDGQPRKIESVLKSGQPILVQVTKDPIGHKGARLTSQVSLPGRFLVYVPDGTTSGISRKLPDTERNRLKTLLKEIVPDTAGVIVRTAAEGASEEELTLDVERLTARWADIEAKVKAGNSPAMLYGEPDLTLKVVRDLFTEDFTKLVVQGDDAWDLVDNYVKHVAPDLQERLERYRPDDEGNDGRDLFAAHRVDEQIAKGVDRKVWLPSGGSLIIDRTEAMTVVDVNTGKFTGSGGNLEETVTKNNLEAAEEIVRQLRLRDIGGIIVIDFIDMVLESNRDLVLRRMVECLGRDRTRHQVAEVTSLGLVQMTRKRIGTGLLEAFSEDCSHCKGRGLLIHEHPIEPSTKMEDDDRRGGRRGRTGRSRSTGPANGGGNGGGNGNGHAPSPRDVAAMAREHAEKHPADEQVDDEPGDETLEHASDDAAQSPAESTVEVESVTELVEHDEPTTETAPEPIASEPASEPESKPESEPEAQVEPAPATEPEPPKLVTSTRRRSARRAAGPPVAVPAPDHVAEAADDSDRDGDESSDELVDGVERDEHGFVLHVPVKRKGSRRR